jgi:hypothetical protein
MLLYNPSWLENFIFCGFQLMGMTLYASMLYV